MNDQPSDNVPGEQETRPSLLATLSLVFALIPLLMVLQRIWVAERTISSVWLQNFLSFRPPFWRVAIFCCFVTSIIFGLKALSDLEINKSLRGRWKAWVGIFLAAFFAGFLVADELHLRELACITNLKMLSTGLTLFECDKGDGQMPPTLEALAKGTFLPKNSTFKCAGSGQRYVYSGVGRFWQANGVDISVYCTCNHRGKCHVLFNDGRVAAITRPELEYALANMKKTDGRPVER